MEQLTDPKLQEYLNINAEKIEYYEHLEYTRN